MTEEVVHALKNKQLQTNTICRLIVMKSYHMLISGIQAVSNQVVIRSKLKSRIIANVFRNISLRARNVTTYFKPCALEQIDLIPYTTTQTNQFLNRLPSLTQSIARNKERGRVVEVGWEGSN